VQVHVDDDRIELTIDLPTCSAFVEIDLNVLRFDRDRSNKRHAVTHC
jgi:hypothetical protein